MSEISDFFSNTDEKIPQLTLVQTNPDIALDCRSYSDTTDWLFEKKDGKWEPLKKLKGQDLEFVWDQIGKMEVSNGQRMINPLYDNNVLESIDKINQYTQLEQKVEENSKKISSLQMSKFMALGSFALMTIGMMNNPSIEKILLGAVPLLVLGIAYGMDTKTKKILTTDQAALEKHNGLLNDNEQEFIKQENVYRRKF